MKEKNEKLFSDFQPASVADWEAKIREDLRGADYEKKLVWKTLEDFRVKPYYTAEDLKNLQYLEHDPGVFPFARGNKIYGNDWEIRQDFIVSDVAAENRKAIAATEKGATSVGFDLSRKGDMYYHDFRQLITGFETGKVSLNFIAGEGAVTMLDFLVRSLDELSLPPEEIRGSFSFDPLGRLISSGGFYFGEEEDFSTLDDMLLTIQQELPRFRALPVSSFYFGNAGASAVQELAFGLAAAAEYLTVFTGKGQAAADLAARMQWNMGTGSDYFMGIAKIRAARVLFSGLLSAFDSRAGESNSIFIHSITTDWNKTVYDANMNMLRLTTEAMAAILGGCNSLVVKPFDTCYREPGEFSGRISRNIQIILKEESFFNRVADPAAGSYYIDSLTDALVEHAWQLFLKTSDQGGFIKAFTGGFIRGEVNKTASRRMEMVATKREVLLGTNHYPSFQEACAGLADPDIVFPEQVAAPDQVTEPLRITRAAVPFEKLRLATENRPEGRPRVFMLTYGNLAMRLARSQFSSGFFAAAGYEITDNLGFASAEEGVEAALKDNADIIVVCSSDEEYPVIAPRVHDLADGKTIVVVAGAPACMEELQQKGIREFIHMRSNILETLKHFHQLLGISI